MRSPKEKSLSGSEGLQAKKQNLSNLADEKIKENVKKDNRPVPVWVLWVLAIAGVIAVLFVKEFTKYILATFLILLSTYF